MVNWADSCCFPYKRYLFGWLRWGCYYKLIACHICMAYRQINVQNMIKCFHVPVDKTQMLKSKGKQVMIRLSEKINLENMQHKCTGDLMNVIMTYVENEGFDAIDWEDALMLLRSFSKNSDDKYNIYPESINNKDELLKLNSSICDAIIGKAPLISRICMDCRKRFYIYLSEKEFFESIGFALPKRCKDCRKNKAKGRKKPEEI